MRRHDLDNFVGPGLASCRRCTQLLDVYEWSEPCDPETSGIPVMGQDTGRTTEMIRLVAA